MQASMKGYPVRASSHALSSSSLLVVVVCVCVCMSGGWVNLAAALGNNEPAHYIPQKAINRPTHTEMPPPPPKKNKH